jgi:hypothetical protein
MAAERDGVSVGERLRAGQAVLIELVQSED